MQFTQCDKDGESFAHFFNFTCETPELAKHNVGVLRNMGHEAFLSMGTVVTIVQNSDSVIKDFEGALFFSDAEGTRLADVGEMCLKVQRFLGNGEPPVVTRSEPGNGPIVGVSDDGGYIEYCLFPDIASWMPDVKFASLPESCSEIGGPAIDLDLIANAMNGDRGDDQQRIAEEGASWVALLLRKNADYGSSAWKAPVLAPECDPDAAMRVRMSDKIERICSLLSKGDAEVASESLEDTIRDLGAYCLLWLTRPK